MGSEMCIRDRFFSVFEVERFCYLAAYVGLTHCTAEHMFVIGSCFLGGTLLARGDLFGGTSLEVGTTVYCVNFWWHLACKGRPKIHQQSSKNRSNIH